MPRNILGASQVAQWITNMPAMHETQEMWLRPLGLENQRMAWQPTPIFLPGESPRTEESGGLQSIGSQRIRQDYSNRAHTPQRHFCLSQLGGGGSGAIGVSWVETRDAVKHPKVLRTASPCPPQRKIYLYTETPIYKNTQRIQIIKGEMVIDATVEKIT